MKKYGTRDAEKIRIETHQDRKEETNPEHKRAKYTPYRSSLLFGWRQYVSNEHCIDLGEVYIHVKAEP